MQRQRGAMPLRTAGLTSRDARGTVSCLLPAARRYAPAWGLVASAAPVLLRNLVSCDARGSGVWGLAASCELARELFVIRGGAHVRPVASRSKAAAHCTPAVLGDILGLALKQKTQPRDVEAALKRRGIATNRVHGEWTGVSMARYVRLHALLATALAQDASAPALPLLLHFVWERCLNRRELLDFLEAASSHVPLLAPDFDAGRFLSDGSDFDESSNDGGAITSDCPRPPLDVAPLVDVTRPEFAAGLEHFAAAMGAAHAFKPAVRVRKHALPNAGAPRPVSDCVEVAIREICEYVAAEPGVQAMRPFSAPLEAFLADAAAGADEAALSATWFGLCQSVLVGHCDFISVDGPTGRPFELAPSVCNVASACEVFLAPLLGAASAAADTSAGTATPATTASLKGLEVFGFTVTAAAAAYRAPASEETRIKETIRVRGPKQSTWLEVEMETLHPLAKVIHKTHPHDLSPARAVVASAAWQAAITAGEPQWLCEAPLIGEDALTALGATTSVHAAGRRWPLAPPPLVAAPVPAAVSRAALRALLCAPLRCSDGDYPCARAWRPLQAATFAADDSINFKHVSAAAAARALLSLRVAAADPALHSLVPWLLQQAPAGVDPVSLGRALAPLPALREAAATVRSSSLVDGRLTWGAALSSPVASSRLLFGIE